LLFTRVLPSAVWTWWGRLNERWGEDLTITQAHDHQTVTVSLCGPATARCVNKAILVFRKAMQTNKRITVDFSNARTVDVRFLGLLLMLNKKLKNTGGQCPVLVGLSPGLKRIFRFNNFDFT
jgi:N-acetylglucosaminyldiphosphoundecaprenol N-acetyl-beta-D-mannosaminyltransferase